MANEHDNDPRSAAEIQDHIHALEDRLTTLGSETQQYRGLHAAIVRLRRVHSKKYGQEVAERKKAAALRA